MIHTVPMPHTRQERIDAAYTANERAHRKADTLPHDECMTLRADADLVLRETLAAIGREGL